MPAPSNLSTCRDMKRYATQSKGLKVRQQIMQSELSPVALACIARPLTGTHVPRGRVLKAEGI